MLDKDSYNPNAVFPTPYEKLIPKAKSDKRSNIWLTGPKTPI